jgi:hypothetical protein
MCGAVVERFLHYSASLERPLSECKRALKHLRGLVAEAERRGFLKRRNADTHKQFVFQFFLEDAGGSWSNLIGVKGDEEKREMIRMDAEVLRAIKKAGVIKGSAIGRRPPVRILRTISNRIARRKKK